MGRFGALTWWAWQTVQFWALWVLLARGQQKEVALSIFDLGRAKNG